MPIPSVAEEVLDREFLELRAGLLQIAAQLDRLDRADAGAAADPRLKSIHQALGVLAGIGPDRAERIQLIFSRPYEENWQQRFELRSE
jgi:hypothetical protein